MHMIDYVLCQGEPFVAAEAKHFAAEAIRKITFHALQPDKNR